MTTEQIIKALEICSRDQSCKKCPYEEGILCVDHLLRDVLSVIQEQQNYIENLKRTISQLRGALREEIYHQEDLNESS